MSEGTFSDVETQMDIYYYNQQKKDVMPDTACHIL